MELKTAAPALWHLGVAVRGSHRVGNTVLNATLPPGQRHGAGGLCARAAGLHQCPLLKIWRPGLGTFALGAVAPAAQVLVYPGPDPAPPLPPPEPTSSRARPGRARGLGEFDGVRAYQRGDPLKLVVWKKAAKSLATGSNDLVSRDTQQSQRQQLWLDFAATSLPAPDRLSRLTAWAAGRPPGQDCTVRLPGGRSRPTMARHTGAAAWRPWRCADRKYEQNGNQRNAIKRKQPFI